MFRGGAVEGPITTRDVSSSVERTPITDLDTVEVRGDRSILATRGQFHQVDDKFPRLSKSTPEGRLAELRRLVGALPSGRVPRRWTGNSTASAGTSASTTPFWSVSSCMMRN